MNGKKVFVEGYIVPRVQTSSVDPSAPPPPYWASPSWGELIWAGKYYKLTDLQAKIVKYLYDQANKGFPEARGAAILKAVGSVSESTRVSHAFRGSEAYGEVVVLGKGLFNYTLSLIAVSCDPVGQAGHLIAPPEAQPQERKPLPEMIDEYDDSI